MKNRQGIDIEPGRFYVDSFSKVCYVERHENGELVYSDIDNSSSITLGGYADLLVAEIKDPKEQIKFISRILKRVDKQGKLEASAQSSAKCTCSSSERLYRLLVRDRNRKMPLDLSKI